MILLTFFSPFEFLHFVASPHRHAIFVIYADVEPPKITNFQPRIFANASQTTSILCETDFEGLFVDVEWFKDGVQVGSCKGISQRNKTCYDDKTKYKIIWTGSGAELIIRNVVHPFDSGNFTCVVKNIAGKDTETVTLDVHGKFVK